MRLTVDYHMIGSRGELVSTIDAAKSIKIDHWGFVNNEERTVDLGGDPYVYASRVLQPLSKALVKQVIRASNNRSIQFPDSE